MDSEFAHDGIVLGESNILDTFFRMSKSLKSCCSRFGQKSFFSEGNLSWDKFIFTPNFTCMKNSILIPVGILLFGVSAFSQEPSGKLNAAFSPKELSAFSADEIGYMNWFADYGYLINDVTGKNLSSYADINSVAKDSKHAIAPDIDPKMFNPYLFNIETRDGQPTVYVIGNSNFTVFFYANEMARNQYNRYKLILEKQ